jgi:hypothetical protein
MPKEKNKGGRPLKYKTPEEMQIAIDEYFEKQIKPTICGLCLQLGFTDRHALLNYEKRDKFYTTIKNTKMRIQQYYEEHLVKPNNSGAIFALKQFRWTDKQDLNIKGNITLSQAINEALSGSDSEKE